MAASLQDQWEWDQEGMGLFCVSRLLVCADIVTPDMMACTRAFDLYHRNCRISGNVDSLARALVMVSRQIRENPPKEKPGGAPPQLASLLAGGGPARYGGPPPAYGAPIAAGPAYR